jgi:hypothetical protein
VAECSCGAELPPRRRVCDSCKTANQKKANARAKATPPEPAGPLDGLKDRGAALWKTLGQELDSSAGQVALEACRTADRLDELDSVIAGKGVLDLMRFRLNPDWWDEDDERHVHVTVGFQSVLAEARQQQTVFKNLLTELGIKAKPAAPATPAPVSPLDQLEQKRRERAQ